MGIQQEWQSREDTPGVPRTDRETDLPEGTKTQAYKDEYSPYWKNMLRRTHKREIERYRFRPHTPAVRHPAEPIRVSLSNCPVQRRNRRMSHSEQQSVHQNEDTYPEEDLGSVPASRYTPNPANSVFETIREAFPSPEPAVRTSEYFPDAFHHAPLQGASLILDKLRRRTKKRQRKDRKQRNRERKAAKGGRIRERRREKNYKKSV